MSKSDLKAEIAQLKKDKLELEAKLVTQTELLSIAVEIIGEDELPETIWWQVRTVPQLQAFLPMFNRSPDLSDLTPYEINRALVEAHRSKIFQYILRNIKPNLVGLHQVMDHLEDNLSRGSYDDWKPRQVLKWLSQTATDLSQSQKVPEAKMNTILEKITALKQEDTQLKLNKFQFSNPKEGLPTD